MISYLILHDLFDFHFFQVYALTKERDTLRREQNRKSDAAALLKEKDEIITQVMAEGIQTLWSMILIHIDQSVLLSG